MNLYELTGQWEAFMAFADDPEVDEEVFADTLEALEGDIYAKADGYGRVIRNLEADVEALKAEATKLQLKAKAKQNHIDRMKAAFQNAMKTMNKADIKTDLFTFRIQKNPPSVVLDEPYIENIPEEYLIQQEPKIDRTKMKNDIKAGKDLSGIAHLEQGESLRIK